MANEYKENILDIIDAWGYALKDTCAPSSAINAGVVELKCFINNSCPFYESPYAESAHIFNQETLEQINKFFPDSLKNVLQVTENIDGMHFAARYVFRHNYIYQFKSDVVVPPGITDEELYVTNFETYFEEIRNISSGSIGANETRYKPEQTWMVVPSVFTKCLGDSDSDSSLGCDPEAAWTYIDIVAKSDATERDMGYDYKSDYFQSYKDSLNSDGTIKEGAEAKILPHHIQVPLQAAVFGENNKGVHWRLNKRTPLFQGEDFFIRFFKMAKKLTSNNNSVTSAFTDSYYEGLDITSTKDATLETRDGEDTIVKPVNYAIRHPGKESKKPELNIYDLYNQSYYVIELGYKNITDNYFILIPERGYPTFVNFVSANDNLMVSKKYGDPFTAVSGSQLINAEYFDITVRNHLGRLIIQFGGDGLENIPPWIVTRTDWFRDDDGITGEPGDPETKIRSLFVPRGIMSLWGGNVRCGFIFTPLQYRSKYVSFIYPPLETSELSDMGSAFNSSPPTEISSRENYAFRELYFTLPSQGNHRLTFSAADFFIENIAKSISFVGVPKFKQELFIQDSQFYVETKETDRGISTEKKYGSFFYEKTIKEFSDDAGALNLKTANITVKKNRYLNNTKTRQQLFDILIGMMSGDHFFTNALWISPRGSLGPPIKEAVFRSDLTENTPSSLPDDAWFLPDCKTPVITSLRLISDPSGTTRWDDGTSIKDGVAFTPFEGDSPYFIDASDHVLSYGDSWSSSNLSEVEHTGTLQFYLNRGMPVSNNVTDALMALQNKTFYVDIWIGYRSCNFTKIDGYYKLFTGLCHGGSIDYEYGKTIMSCKIEDYSAVLKGMRVFNSPWFDGMKDVIAIREIMQMAGFRDKGKYDPGALIKHLSDSAINNKSGIFFHHFDGRMFKQEPFALPMSYSILDQASYKYKSGTSYMDMIADIAKKSGKVFFFDEFGIAHYENPQDLIKADFLGESFVIPLYYFTTNPEINPGQLVFNKVERSYGVDGMYNKIRIISMTPDFSMISSGDINWSSISNPETEGFLGYEKIRFVQEGLFGSKEAVADAIRNYRVGFRPKIHVKFETYGVPLRINDIVRINGEDCRVVSVSHTVNAETNSWMMKVDCEKYQTVISSRTTG